MGVAGVPARESTANHTSPPAPPAEYQALYDELEQKLTEFEGQLDAEWSGGVGTGRFAAALSSANGNKSAGLLHPFNWARMIEQLDAYQAMGVELVKIDTHYPVFTPAFHTFLAASPPVYYPNYAYTLADFIGTPTSFYNRLVDEIRARGFGLWIEHSTLFNDFSPTPPGAYFADMRTAGLAATQARYASERSAEAVLITSELAPDYYTLVDEPTTQNANFGYFAGQVPIYSATGWRDYTESVAQQIIAAVPGSPALLGAGSGTWEGRTYTELFAALPELDYIDFHIYPIETPFEDFWQNALDWADYVRAVAPEKLLTIGETWLYKVSEAELVSGLPANDIFGRDVYSFWEPLDSQHLEVMFKLLHYKGFEAVMPFWATYYFAYLTHGDPDLVGLTVVELLSLAGQEAIPNIQTVTLTGTGEKFQEIIDRLPDADGDGTPDSADAGDADGDGVTDQAEHYCGGVAISGARRPERVDGPFAGADDDGDGSMNEALPVGSAAYDCDGDGFSGAAEDHVYSYLSQLAGDQKTCQEYDVSHPNPSNKPSRRWPADLSGHVPASFSNNKVNVSDLGSFIAPVRYFGTDVGTNAGDVRWDLVPGSTFGPEINVQDLAALTAGTAAYPAMLGGVRAFGGPACPWAP